MDQYLTKTFFFKEQDDDKNLSLNPVSNLFFIIIIQRRKLYRYYKYIFL